MKVLLTILGIIATIGTSALIIGLIALIIKKKSQISWSWSWLIIGISLIVVLFVGLKFISFSEEDNGVDAPPAFAPGIFIIPPGGKEVSRDTTGKRIAYRNVGDKILIKVLDNAIPEALYFQNIKEKSARIRKRRTVLVVVNLLGGHVRFKNFGVKTVKAKVTIIPRHA